MRTPVGVAIASVVIMAAGWSFSPRTAHSVPALPALIDGMHVNSIARSGKALVAGGELGHLMLSHDQGASWQAARLSQQRQALINQVVFADGIGIAVGHEGWILRSSNGGADWREQAFDRSDGAPLMSAARLPSGQWLAVGAFGRALASGDNGLSWDKLALPGVEDAHLNRIAASANGRHWLIVGERGLVLRSDQHGESWEAVTPFYTGSFYGAAHLAPATWVVYGMRGNVFRSDDNGGNWTRSALPAPVSVMSHAVDANGRLLLAGQGGMLFASSDRGASFSLLHAGGRATLTDLVELPRGGWLAASDRGLRDLSPAINRAGAAPGQLIPGSTK